VITQKDPSNYQALARCEADDIATTLSEPQSTTQHTSSRPTTRYPESSTSVPQISESLAIANPPQHALDHDVDRIDDEDYELQAALQASLASQEGYTSSSYELEDPEPSISSPPPLTSATTSARATRQPLQGSSSPDPVDLDPVAASMERNRELLQRMREEQEYAQRELWSSNDRTNEERAAQEAWQLKRREREEKEEEELQKAIAESEAMAQDREGHQSSNDSSTVPENAAASTSLSPLHPEFRNYDDEDAELQAALKASLENVPSGWHQPVPSSSAPRLPEPRAPLHTENPKLGKDKKTVANSQDDLNVDGDGDEWMSESEAPTDDDNTVVKEINSVFGEQNASPSLDEIRKARLARFGL
jgi:ataxin-3